MHFQTPKTRWSGGTDVLAAALDAGAALRPIQCEVPVPQGNLATAGVNAMVVTAAAEVLVATVAALVLVGTVAALVVVQGFSGAWGECKLVGAMAVMVAGPVMAVIAAAAVGCGYWVVAVGYADSFAGVQQVVVLLEPSAILPVAICLVMYRMRPGERTTITVPIRRCM